MIRDPAYEDEFLADLDRHAALQGGLAHQPVGGFVRLVRERLDLGQRVHGDRFLGRDCLAEALEEPCDAVAWGLLELQRLRRAGTDPVALEEARLEILGAAVMAARADQCLRRARRLLASD